MLEFDNLPLARTYNAAWRQLGGGSRALIGFSVATREEVDARYADLVAAGHKGRQPPYDTFWGARYARLSRALLQAAAFATFRVYESQPGK